MADNIEVGDLVARISFDDTGLNKSMAEINRQMKLVSSEFGKAGSALKGYGDTEAQLKTKSEGLSAEMQLQQQKINRLNQAFQESVREKGEDNAATQRLATQLNNAQTQYNNLDAELRQTNEDLAAQQRAAQIAASEWTKMGASLTAAGDQMKKVGDNMSKVGKNMSMYITGPIVAVGALATKSASDFESAFAGVRKTVDATEEEFAYFSNSLRDMAKAGPSTASELASIAEAAGQLGIENKSLLSFTNTMSDLGVATNMSSEEAATSLARLANITKMPQENFDRLGSSIVALGNNFATTESEITEMALRLSGAGAQVGMSEADILGLSAALSSVGIEAEMGGSAISRVMVRMQVASSAGFSKVNDVLDQTGMSIRDLQMMASHSTKAFGNLAEDMGMTKKELTSLLNSGVDLENFAKIAGVTGEEFKTAFEKDAVGALGSFINGLGGAEAAGDSAINMLQEMGVTEVRLRDSLLRAGNASELFAKSIDISNVAWEENSALTNEAAERYKTFDSQMKTFRNKLTDVGITLGEVLIPVLLNLVDSAQPLIDAVANIAQKFGELDPAMQQVIFAVVGIVAALGPALVVIGMVISSIGSIVSAFGAMATAIGAAGGASAVFGTVIAAITGPIGIAVAAIVGIVAAFTILYNKNETFRNFINKTWDEIKNKFVQTWQAIISFVMPLINDMVAFFKEQLGFLKAFWDENGAAILAVVKTTFDIIVGLIKINMAIIGAVIGAAWEVIKVAMTISWNAIKFVISTALDLIIGTIKFWIKVFQGDWEGAWDTVLQTVKHIWGNVESFFKNVNLSQIGKDIMQGLIDGIKSMTDKIKNIVSDVADSVKNGLKSALKINSPSKVTTELGEWTGQGLADGLENSLSTVSKQAAAMANVAIPNISRASSAASGLKSGSNSITVNVTGNTITEAGDEDRLVAKISRALAKDFGMAVGGAF